jgi:intracellular sulfur oxidation DsrE/DsrF family protein
MLRADTSPVKDRLKRLKELAFPASAVFGLRQHQTGYEKTEGKEVPILSEASLVPSGVVRLMELQEKGWSYLRP